MRYIAFFLIIFLFCGVNPAFSEECDTTLKSTDTYQDLSIILNCLARKISNVEKRIGSLGNVSQDESQDAVRGVPSVLVDNRYFTLYDLRAFRGNGEIRVAFTIRSKYDKDFFMLLLSSRTSITNEFGIPSSINNNSSAVVGIDHAPNTRSYSGYSKTHLSPGTNASASLAFRDIPGSHIDFSSGLLLFLDPTQDKFEQFSFGATKVQVAE